MTTDMKEITRAETTGSYRLWYGILAPPIVWACQLLLDFGLNESVACAPGSRIKGQFFHTSIDVVIQIVNLVATVLAVLAFVLAFGCYRKLRAGDSTDANRARWMAIAGMFDSALFLMLILAKFLPVLFLHGCEGF
jgi:hypothetical protein